jgi:hypothetical protein
MWMRWLWWRLRFVFWLAIKRQTKREVSTGVDPLTRRLAPSLSLQCASRSLAAQHTHTEYCGGYWPFVLPLIGHSRRQPEMTHSRIVSTGKNTQKKNKKKNVVPAWLSEREREMLFAAAGFSKLGQQDQKPGCPHASAETKSSNNKIPLLLSLHKKSDPRVCVRWSFSSLFPQRLSTPHWPVIAFVLTIPAASSCDIH